MAVPAFWEGDGWHNDAENRGFKRWGRQLSRPIGLCHECPGDLAQSPRQLSPMKTMGK